MLKRLEDKDICRVLSYLTDDAVSVRIKANLSVYKTDYEFAQFWAQYGDKNEITAVLSIINGAGTLTFSDAANTDELKALLDFIPHTSVFAKREKAESLNLKSNTYGDILCFRAKAQECGDANDFADMKEAFSLISENEGKSVVKLDYLEWLSDFTFKANRNAARLKALTLNEKLVSFAMTGAETKEAAIISGVFTEKEMQGQGYGTRVLEEMINGLIKDNKKIYIMTAEKRMTAYYEKRGFEIVGSWAEEIQ